MVNLHSHAHQRALAGRGEGIGHGRGAGSFWEWRTQMYRLVARLSPDDLEAIASLAYVEMLEAGFTTVGEFHYLHHDRDGGPYTNPAEMAERILAAAVATGIGLTLLPSFYTQGGIGVPAAPEQRRFVHHLEDFLRLMEDVLSWEQLYPRLHVGVAPHSLRAVHVTDLAALVEVVRQRRPPQPIHIHVAEQVREIEECRVGLGAPPVQWLLDHLPVDEGWTIIHATHTNATERQRLAERGAIVGLCPVTEANLGDGLFSLAEYHAHGGTWGIGTDSNTAISVADELRLLEYGQRLTLQRRDVLVAHGDAMTEQPGRLLYDRAVLGGAQALAQAAGTIEVGQRADLVELDPAALAFTGHVPATILDAWLVGGRTNLVRTVFVSGKPVVQEYCHRRREEIEERFRDRMRMLWA